VIPLQQELLKGATGDHRKFAGRRIDISGIAGNPKPRRV
jgi:hypothetical protein